jgi:hypothetical protein
MLGFLYGCECLRNVAAEHGIPGDSGDAVVGPYFDAAVL